MGGSFPDAACRQGKDKGSPKETQMSSEAKSHPERWWWLWVKFGGWIWWVADGNKVLATEMASENQLGCKHGEKTVEDDELSWIDMIAR